MTESFTTVEHRVRSADGVELWCRDYRPLRAAPAAAGGAGAPVVLCVPGLTRNSRDFDSLASALAATHRVLTPDLRGRGRSGRAADYLTMTHDRVENPIILLLESIGPSALMGHSMGGRIIFSMLGIFKKRIEKKYIYKVLTECNFLLIYIY